MNFLAHAYLSFNIPALLVGNMISDFVKGKKQFDYSKEIHNGIRLHRAIDNFTDEHKATKEAKLFLKPVVGSYSGAFIDVVYDHFLANDRLRFSDQSLSKFAEETYLVLYNYEALLPDPFRLMLPYMREQNWLYNYKTVVGIEKSFDGIVRRAKYLNSSQQAFGAFERSYLPLQKCYSDFFSELEEFAAQQLQAINNS